MAKNVITVKLLGDAKGLSGVLDKTESRLGKFGSIAGTAFLGIGAGAVAAGGGLLALGTNLDSAVDNIIIGTGASGTALEGLKTDFEAVASSVPASFGDASTAVADLNTRLGLTGEPLQQMSGQFLELSRLTGTDLSTNISNMSRVFGDAGVATEDQSAALDMLFTASQASGVGLDKLSTTLVQFGAPMRQLGFSFEESTALLAKFDKEGVNTEAVMSGLKIGLGKFAKAGEEPAEALANITEAIKGAGSAGEANQLAIEAFGQRAGPDMAAAIREGRFEIDDMVTAIADSEGSIQDTSDATMSWQQRLKVLMNKFMIKIGPLAEKVFDMVEKAVAAVSPHLEVFAAWLGEKIPPLIAQVSAWFERNWPTIRAVIEGLVQWLVTSAWPVMQQIFAGIVTVVSAVVAWFVENWPTISATIDTVVAWLRDVAWPILQQIFAGIMTVVAAVVTWFEENWPQIQATIEGLVTWLVTNGWPVIEEIFGFIQETVQGIVDWVVENWPLIQETISTVIGAVQTVIETFVDIVLGIWSVFGDTIMSVIDFAWTTIQVIIETVIGVIQGILETVMSLITGDWQGAWDGIKGIVDTVWEGIKTLVSGALETVETFISDAWEGITTAFQAIWDTITEKAGEAVDGVVEFIEGLPERILEWVESLLDAGKDLGQAIVDGMVGAITGAAGLAADLASGIVDAVRGAWNSFAGTINELIPNSIGWGPASIDLPDNPIPTFHTGGWVGNPRGPATDVPAILQQGEYVLSRDDVASLGASSNGGPLVEIGEYHSHDGTDVDGFAAALNMRIAA